MNRNLRDPFQWVSLAALIVAQLQGSTGLIEQLSARYPIGTQVVLTLLACGLLTLRWIENGRRIDNGQDSGV